MLKKIDHVGIAVPDLESVKHTFSLAFNLQPEFEEEVSDQKVKIAGFHLADSTVEYLQPTSEDSPIARFLQKKGSGIHHIAYKVENISKLLKRLENKGFQLIDKTPKQGAQGKKIAFIHPKSTNGILIELCEGE